MDNHQHQTVARSPEGHTGSLVGEDDTLIRVDQHVLRDHFNKRSFSFQHELADHPLFQTQRLLQLAKSLPEQDVQLKAGDITIGDKWRSTASTIDDAMEHLEGSDSWIMLKRVEHDPEYKALLDSGLRQLDELLQQPVRATASKMEAFIFIASPNAVTPFHIDPESTFLFQVRGEKTISVCDPDDRNMLTRPEIEKFYRGDLLAAKYKPAYKDNARVYALKPGTGVHLPVIAPHWVQNADNVSVTLTISFKLPDERSRKRVYVANYFMRKFFNLDGSEPGSNAMWDLFRSAAGGAAERAIAMRRYYGTARRNRL